MTTVTMEQQLTPFAALLERLVATLDQNDPLHSIRIKAWQRFIELGGLPSFKQRGFQYIPLRKLYGSDFEQPTFQLNCHCTDESVVILPFAEAFKTYGAFLEHRLKRLLKEEADPFALLNLALMQQAIFVYVPPGKGVQEPLTITYPEGLDGFCCPRIHLFIGKGSSIEVKTIFEKAYQNAFINESLDITLEEGAHCTHIQSVTCPWYFRTLRCLQKRDSVLKSLHTTFGGSAVRDAYHVVLTGENAEANLFGLWRLQEQRQSHTHVVVDHQAPHCRSRQHFKGVLDDLSRSSFEGKILVQKEAQQTDAFQMNNNLILGKRAHADSQPNLEIFADDVKASHGATVGQLDAENLFYLNTRGICEHESKNLLVNAFCDEILQEFSHAQTDHAWGTPRLS